MGEPHLSKVDIYHLNKSDLNVSDLYNILRLFVHTLSDLAVPCFFLFSGFLFFFVKNEDEEFNILPKLKRRITSLIVPYLLWNIIAILLLWLQYCVKLKSVSFSELISLLNEKGWLHIFWDSTNRLGQSGAPADMPLWYLRDLIVMVFVISPFLVYILKNKLCGMILLMSLFLLKCFGVIPDITGLSSNAVFWYGMGGYIAIHNIPLIGISSKCKWGLSFFSILSLISYILLRGSEFRLHIFLFLFIISTMPLLFLLTFHFDEKLTKFLEKMQPSVFFIFAAHILILGWCRSFVKMFSGDVFVTYLIPPLLAVGVCTISYFVLHRLFPKFCTIINGR